MIYYALKNSYKGVQDKLLWEWFLKDFKLDVVIQVNVAMNISHFNQKLD